MGNGDVAELPDNDCKPSDGVRLFNTAYDNKAQPLILCTTGIFRVDYYGYSRNVVYFKSNVFNGIVYDPTAGTLLSDDQLASGFLLTTSQPVQYEYPLQKLYL